MLSTQTQIEIQKALKDDPTVYEYDAVYDEMEEKKKAVNVKIPEKDRKVPVVIVTSERSGQFPPWDTPTVYRIMVTNNSSKQISSPR